MRTFPRRMLLLCARRTIDREHAIEVTKQKDRNRPRTTQQARGRDITTVNRKRKRIKHESEKGKRARGMVVAW